MPTEILPDRFRDARVIGRGGMGEIVLATDSLLDRKVAIKLLSERYAEDEGIRKRFTREALAAARLSSAPNTVTIFDVGEADGRPFIVMEYLDGGSLEERLRRGPISPADALEWLEQAAGALDAAHEGGVVHRDVKPGNLLLDRQGNVHVADFGVASAAGLDSLTAAGTVVGTAGYLSPEQARGERATPASDRYALGVVAFELLTGERPYAADSIAAEASAHVHAPIPSIHERDPRLPPQLDAVFEKALAKDPRNRYPTCTELVAALRRAVAEAEAPTRKVVADERLAAAAPPRRAAAGTPWRWAALAALVAALGAGGVALAAALTGDGEERSANEPRTIEKKITVTERGETVEKEVTVTQPAPPPPPSPPPPSPTSPPAGGESGVALTDRSTNLMRQGRYEEALPVAQQGLAKLKGSGDLYEAYANYNVGRSLIELGRCEEGLPYIAESERLQGSRSEFAEARAKCRE